MANYIISFTKLTKGKDGNIYTKQCHMLITKDTKREIDLFVSDLSTNLNYSNIKLRKVRLLWRQ